MQVRVQKWGNSLGSDSQALAQDAEVEEELV
jgi:antitoxin component of MazEF toxin-antitoxin module